MTPVDTKKRRRCGHRRQLHPDRDDTHQEDESPRPPLGERDRRGCAARDEIGITTVHLHARDEATGDPAWDSEIYGRIIEGIRAYSKDLVIGVSTSGRRFVRFDQRADCLRLDGDRKPDMGSLTLSSVNFNKQASVNSPEMIRRLAEEMAERAILPELEAFDAGMINYAKYLAGQGVLKPPHYFNLILGNIACAQADLLHVGVMVRDLPPESYWVSAGSATRSSW